MPSKEISWDPDQRFLWWAKIDSSLSLTTSDACMGEDSEVFRGKFEMKIGNYFSTELRFLVRTIESVFLIISQSLSMI